MIEDPDSSDNYAFLGPAENEDVEGCTGDDSGFSEAAQWKKHMQHPPGKYISGTACTSVFFSLFHLHVCIASNGTCMQ